MADGALELNYVTPRDVAPPGSAVGAMVGRTAVSLAWAFSGLVVAAGLLVGAFFLLRLFTVYAAVVGLVVLVVVGRGASTARRRRGAIAVGHVAQAVRMNLPLPAMLVAAERSEPSRAVRRDLARLRQSIESGTGVGEALERSVPGLDPRAGQVLDAADRQGALPSALARLEAEQAAERRGDAGLPGFAGAYALGVVAVAFVILVGIMVFVGPKFESIFRDFGVPLPPPTRALFAASAWASSSGAAAVAAAVLVLAVGHTVGRALRDLLRPPRRPIPRVRRLDPIAWRLPVVGGLVRARQWSDVCTAVADALDAGRTLPDAVEEANRPYLNATLRGRLERWSGRMESGESPGPAARSAGAPRLVWGLLSTAGPSGRTGEALRFCARHYAMRSDRLAVALRAAVGPAMSLLLGVVVGGVALALYLPLVRLIEATSQKVYP